MLLHNLKHNLNSLRMSGNCGKCSKKLKVNQSKVDCCDCHVNFHLSCVGVTQADLQFLQDNSESWRCDPCAKIRRKSMLVETTSSMTYEDVVRLVSDLKQDFNRVEKSLGESLNSCHNEISDLKKVIEGQQTELKSWKTMVENLTAENKNLKKTITELEARQDNLEQYSRRNTLEIHGVPYDKEENVVDVVKMIGEALDYPIEESMIDACHRMGKPKQGSSSPPGIIVKMVRRFDADALLTRRRAKKQDFSTRHMGLPTDNPVYVNESLSPGRRRLLNAARDAKGEKNYLYLWIRNGKILMRKANGAPVIAVENMDDIAKL